MKEYDQRLLDVSFVSNPSTLGVRLERSVERIATGLVCLECALPAKVVSPSVHWRYGDWTKPPVDLSVDQISAEFRAIRVYVQEDTVIAPALAFHTTSSCDRIAFDKSGWSAETRYIDYHGEERYHWTAGTSLSIFFGSQPDLFRGYRLDSQLTFFITRTNKLIGIAFEQLSHKETALIQSVLKSSP